MKSINEIINEITAAAKQKTIDAIWDRVDFINTLLDAAYSDGVCGDYGYALKKAGDAVNAYMELVELCKETTEQPLREHLRDALGSVNWEKFELPANMMAAIKKARNDAANQKTHPLIADLKTYPFITEDPVKLIGLWCNKITKELKGDFDEDIPWNQKHNKPTIKLYEKATVYPENKEKIIWKSFDSMDDLEEYLK